MDRIDTTSPQYIFQNSAGYLKRISRNEPSPAGEKENGSNQPQALSQTINNEIKLTADQLSVIQKLKSRDQQVKTHEMAHVSAGGQYVTSGVNFSYQKGPDGIMYAVGGEVGIDLSAIANNPQATIAKMQVVRNAALAPSDPSPQDRRVAATASQIISSAQTQLLESQSSNDKEEKDSGTRVNGAKLYESSPSEKGETIDISA